VLLLKLWSDAVETFLELVAMPVRLSKALRVGPVKRRADPKMRGAPARRLTCPTVCSAGVVAELLTAGLFHQGNVLLGERRDSVHVARSDGLFFDEG
jgi:hypothetical protein